MTAKKQASKATKKPSVAVAKNSASAGKRDAQPEKAKKKTKKRKRKTNGFAATKAYPTKKHPARYKRKRNGDDIEYITFTHSGEVEIDGETEKTIPLNSNINPRERGQKISYAYPKVYVGIRSALGSERDKFSLTEEDKKLVDELFVILPKVEVRYTSNSKKKAKNKKPRK